MARNFTLRRGISAVVGATVVCGMVLVWGCGRDARLAGAKLREPTVGPLTAYGKILDQNASPQDVVGVLLKAVAADYAAGDDRAKREEVLDVEFALSAPAFIKDRLLKRQDSNDQRLQERYYGFVYHWAPTLGHYRAQFDADYADLAKRMHVVTVPIREGSPPQVEVLVNLDAPPSSDDAHSGPVVARIGLVKESGFWRVWNVGWDAGLRDWHSFVRPRAKAAASNVENGAPKSGHGDSSAAP